MTMNKKIPSVIKIWEQLISKRNPKIMSDLYRDNAILLATYEPLLIGRENIMKYFVEFLDKENLQCNIIENYTQVNAFSQTASGIYLFSFSDKVWKNKVVKARYSFVIESGKIINHHSSIVPE